MHGKQFTSPIWKADKEWLEDVVNKADSLSDVLRQFGLRAAGGNHRVLKLRLNTDGISFEHFTRAAQFKKHITVTHDDLFCENSRRSRNTLRRWIINKNLIPYWCDVCSLGPVWEGKSLTLRLDHINGVYNDNRLDNLRWVCPNCDSQLDTFCSRNKRNLGSNP